MKDPNVKGKMGGSDTGTSQDVSAQTYCTLRYLRYPAGETLRLAVAGSLP